LAEFSGSDVLLDQHFASRLAGFIRVDDAGIAGN